MPVARETTSAISSTPTCVRRSLHLRPALEAMSRVSASFSCFSSCGILPYCSSLIFCQSPLRLASSISCLAFSSSSLMCVEPCTRAFSAFQHFLEVGVFLLQALDLVLDEAEALLRGLVLLLLHRLALDLELDDAAVEAVHHLGLGVDLHLDARGRLVDEVDRLVGQEAVGDVAVRELGRGDDRRVGDVHAVVDLVLLLQAAQDGDGVLDRGLVHEHLLEAALERGVLLDVLAVFVERGGADAMQLAARERGLEHVAGVHGAFGLAGADHGVQLVDEDDGLALVLRELLQHALQPLLEFAAVLGAGDEHAHVERQHALAAQALGHLVVDDALREAFDDGGLAHAGLADEHRVVLGAALQDLDHAADLLVAADDRVELAAARARSVRSMVYFFSASRCPSGFGVVHGLAAAHRLDGLLERRVVGAVLLEQPAGLALVLGRRRAGKARRR